jgi:hypothetical protein
VFDVWIYNEDRHDENLIYHPNLGLWLIDHDQALAGPTLADPSDILPNYNDHPIRRHVFRGEHLDAGHVGQWVQLIQRFPMSVVNGIIDTGRRAGVYPAPYGDATRRFLRYRQANLPQLVEESRL